MWKPLSHLWSLTQQRPHLRGSVGRMGGALPHSSKKVSFPEDSPERFIKSSAGLPAAWSAEGQGSLEDPRELLVCTMSLVWFSKSHWLNLFSGRCESLQKPGRVPASGFLGDSLAAVFFWHSRHWGSLQGLCNTDPAESQHLCLGIHACR